MRSKPMAFEPNVELLDELRDLQRRASRATGVTHACVCATQRSLDASRHVLDFRVSEFAAGTRKLKRVFP